MGPHARRPRILFLAEQAQWPPPLIGAQLRVHRIIAALAAEFDVEVWAAVRGETAGPAMGWPLPASIPYRQWTFDPEGSRHPLWVRPQHILHAIPRNGVASLVRHAVPGVLARALAERGAHDFDVVWANGAAMGEAARDAGFPTIIVDVDDFEGQMALQALRIQPKKIRWPLHRLLAQDLARYERKLRHRFAGVVIAKASDRALLDEGRGQVFEIANGVDIPPVSSGAEAAPHDLLFVGALTYGPNVDGVVWFIDSVLPLIRREEPRARLVIAGRGPAPNELLALVDDRAVTLVQSPASVAPFYENAGAVIAPIRLGDGTRIKVLEALAYGKPLVATSESARGLPLQHRTHYLAADTPTEFAERVVDVIRDRRLAGALSADGRLLMQERFSWDLVGGDVRRAVRDTLRARDAASWPSRAPLAS